MRLICFYLSLILVAMQVSGCTTSPPSRHYYLTPLAARDGSPAEGSRSPEMIVAIAPIRIAKYIDRPQIVTRIGPNKIHMDEFNRWAGSLKDNITNVLVQNLSALLSRSQILRHPVPTSMAFAYEVFVDIIQFDGIPGEHVKLIANVVVSSKGMHAAASTKYIPIDKTEPVDARSYDRLAAAQSRLLADLSHQIARTLNSFHVNQARRKTRSGDDQIRK